MFLSVVLSFYNEAPVLPELVRRLRATLEPEHAGDFELIFVNDASTDGSLQTLRELAQGHHDIRIINMSRNFGVSPCVMAGLRMARGEVVVYLDADLQDPPELIPTLIARWREERAEVVYTTRLHRAGESRFKLGVTRLGYRILGAVSDIDVPADSGDFKLLSRRVVAELLQLEEHKPFVRGLVRWVGFKQVQVFYERAARPAGQTHFPVLGWKVINNFLDSALISFSDVPLKLALFLGFLVSVGAFLYLVVIFIMKFTGYTIGGWAAIMATLLVLGGVQLITIGALGLYINAIYRETRRRPRYIIENTFGFEEEPPHP